MKRKLHLLPLLVLIPWFMHSQGINANLTFAQLATCPMPTFAPATFAIGNTVYIISGATGNCDQEQKTLTNVVWAFNVVSNSWSQKSNFPGLAVYGASAFVINGMGYVVNGWDSSGTGTGPNQLWQYNPGTDTWTSEAAFPGATRYGCACFTLNNIGYIAFGGLPELNDMWAYDPSANTWTQKASFPGLPRESPAWLVINNYAYAGMGLSYDTYTGGQFTESDWYKYDPIADSWTQMGYFPGDPLALPYSVVINNTGYLINGAVESSLNAPGNLSNKVWQYTPGTDSWTVWGLFPGSFPMAGGGFAGMVGSSGYFGMGAINWYNYGVTNAFWKFGADTTSYSCTASITAVYVSAAQRDFEANGNFSPTAQLNWNFGDNTTGTGISVFHVFPGPGTYTVTLEVSDTAGGGCADSTSAVITITNVDSCSVTISSTNIGADYTLEASPTGAGPFTYNWTSPGNPSFNSNVPDPYVLLNPNTPTAFCLTITDTTGCQASACDSITYVPATITCQTYFYVAPDPNYPGVYDCYVFHSGATPVSYLWSFGDGDTSTLPFPTHSYATPGYYNICLTIIDSNNCVSTYCDSAFYAFKTGGGPMSYLNTFSGNGPNPAAVQNISNSLGLSVYPNPATDEITITVTGNKLDEVLIYSAEGQKVATFETPASNIIQVKNLASGMYFADVKVGESSGRVRFVKIN